MPPKKGGKAKVEAKKAVAEVKVSNAAVVVNGSTTAAKVQRSITFHY
jgi:hypothetical protein